jgi:Trk K+ transport system NAD-binding subunit
VESSVESWEGHVVVCGLHDEGLRIVEQLHTTGVAVVVVDDEPDPRLLRALGTLGAPLLRGDSRLAESLNRAGFARAAALICAESDDIHTLATALLARELRPDARVVVQLTNAAVGRALADLDVQVLDTARLAAPSIVESCLATGTWSLRLGDLDFRVVETTVLEPGRLRDLYGDLAPIAVVPRDGAPAILTPGRDVEVGVGDLVVIAGAAEEVGSVTGASGGARRRTRTVEAPSFVGARAPRAPRTRPTLFRELVASTDRRLKLVLLGLFVLAGTSVAMLRLGYEEASGRRMSVLDALYFTVETIATVGYGDFNFRDQPSWLRSWAICLMLIGATLVTVSFALLTNALVSRRLEETLGRRRITGLDDHVVVVGVGSVGVAVVERLLEQEAKVVVVEADGANRHLDHLRGLGVPLMVGDATSPDTLAALHLDTARAVAVLTSDDLANIETGLAVRDVLGARWADVPVVLRLFEPRLAETVRSSFDFHHVRSPAALAAPWFVGAALGLQVIDTFYVGTRPMLVARLDIVAGSGLDGLAMRDLPARIRVLALVRADGLDEHPPRRDTSLSGGDAAYVVGPYAELLLLLRAHAVAGNPVAPTGVDPSP